MGLTIQIVFDKESFKNDVTQRGGGGKSLGILGHGIGQRCKQKGRGLTIPTFV